jgi:hypothetical protein
VIASPALRIQADSADVRESLRRFGAVFTGERLEGALVASALPIVNAAKQNAHVVTGTLRRSIHIGGYAELTPDFGSFIGPLGPDQAYGDIGGNSHTHDTAVVFVGTNLAYAAREEFGFVGKDSLGRTYDQEAHPYLRPAFDDNVEVAAAECRAAFRQMLDSALRAP